MPSLLYVGTGEALDPHRSNTSLLYRGSKNVLFDCGYAVPHALWRWLDDPEALDGVYLSHLHADHAFGLPALCLWMRLEGRKRPLTLLGAPQVLAGARRLLDLGYPGSFAAEKCFPIVDHELSTGVDGTAWFEGVEFHIAPSAHKRMRNFAVQVTDDGAARFAYSGDGQPTDGTRRLYQDCPLVVHECFGAQADDTAEGHAALDQLLEMAQTQRVQRLHLLHFDRHRADEIRQRIDRLNTDFEVVAPTAGDEVTL